ncbi:unnamed protein product [Brachionus calyciflorus]|uniref:CCHC-type domain-containing protein n=1 Tax=Brachionus calyciflorus TaxID=104777 RepID=A0A814L7A7_9BILA|nr:unnamed protein product [Brachionus calyciflorus]
MDDCTKSKLLRTRLFANAPENSVDYKSITSKVDDESILVNRLNAMSLKTPTKFSGECFYCQKPGHRKSDCRKRLSDEKYGGNVNQRRYNNDRKNMRVSFNNVDRTPNSRHNDESRRYGRRTDERVKSKHAFVIDAEIDDDGSEYELNSIEYSIECNGLRVNGLDRVNLVVKLGDSFTNVRMLVDSGSSGSFINPAKLPANLREKIETFLKDANDPNEYDLTKSTINIKAALSAKRVNCAIGDLIVSSNGWFGKHQFIFADVAEAGILGLDFLKKFNAVIDYANDRITIKDGEKDIYLIYLSNNSISATSEAIIKCNTGDELIGRDLLFQPNCINEFFQDLVFGKCLSKINENGEILIMVVNVSGKDVVLASQLQVGTVQEVDALNVRQEVDHEVNEKIDVSKLKINPLISTSERNEILKLVLKHHKAFKWCDDDTGLTDITEHDLDTGNTRPIKQRPYRLPQSAQEEVRKQVNDMLKKNIIRESKSPWCSPIILVKKKADEMGKSEFRFCIDFRKLNEATAKNCYPLPRIDDTVDALGGSKYFTTLDLASGYWQYH